MQHKWKVGQRFLWLNEYGDDDHRSDWIITGFIDPPTKDGMDVYIHCMGDMDDLNLPDRLELLDYLTRPISDEEFFQRMLEK